jgi:uroporphyrinogen-III synthase
MRAAERMAAGYHGGCSRRAMETTPAHGPLSGWRVLVTRPREQALALARALEAEGAQAVVLPTIELGPPPSWAPFDEAVSRLSGYAWLVFTSPSAVRYAFDHAPQLATLLGTAPAPAVAAVGTETAKALAGHGVTAFVPQEQRQEGLIETLAGLRPGAAVLFPQTIGGRETLREALEGAGISVDVVPVSETLPVNLQGPPPPFDVATFASPSALRAFVSGLGVTALAGKVVAVIGPTTEAAARELGITVDVVAPTPSVSALVAALCAYRASAID